MIVPRFWAEARVQHRQAGRQVTVRRFGWSDTSEADAQTRADARVREALDRILHGEKLNRRELKVPYNGAEGVPIREEILAEHGNTIITRNSYGAHCLNTPDVLFADVDFPESPAPRLVLIFSILVFLPTTWFLWQYGAGWRLILVPIVALFFGFIFAGWFHRARTLLAGGIEKYARRRIEAYAAKHPECRLRLYRTPSGFRVLAMHRLFDPGEPAVADFFTALGTDPVYVRMCLRQRCFRARLTPKPWRIGITEHSRPRPGVWPLRPEALPARQAWVARYEQASTAYAACHFVADLGQGLPHDTVRMVQQLHDELCRAESALPMA